MDEKLIEILRDVIDPETGHSIVDMGMIYRAEMIGDRAEVDFTLTYPGCPIGEEIEEEIRSILNVRSGAKEIVARMVWTPRWTEDRMSEELRLEYGYPV